MDELPRDNRTGDIPLFADEQGIVFQRRRPAVGQVVTLGGGADDDQPAAKIIAQGAGLAKQPLAILREGLAEKFK